MPRDLVKLNVDTGCTSTFFGHGLQRRKGHYAKNIQGKALAGY